MVGLEEVSLQSRVVEAEGLDVVQVAAGDLHGDGRTGAAAEREDPVEADVRQLRPRRTAAAQGRDQKETTEHADHPINSAMGRPSLRIGMGRWAASWNS